MTARQDQFPAMTAEVPVWLGEVAAAWVGYWKDHDQAHRYRDDFAAFVGERLLTDFDLRDIERAARGTS